MTDSAAANALEMSSDVNVDAMTSQQAATKLAELGQQTEWRDKLLSGDGRTTKLFQQLTEKRSQTATAESLIAAAADPNAPQPRDGGANNKAGMSKRDEVQEVQWHLATGASLEEAAEWQIGEAMVSPSDFQAIERTVRAQLENPDFAKDYLAGKPYARAIMDRWHRIAVLSRPLPPTTAIRHCAR